MEHERIQISQIVAFERVAREGNFTRAAVALGFTQPAISTRVAELEKELGGQLFERRGRQLALTPLGQRFLPYAERVLAVIADGLQEVHNFHTGKTGELKVAALNPFILSLIPDPLEQFRTEYPAVDIRVWQRLKPDILNMLYDGVTTIGLINAPHFDQNLIPLAHFQEDIRGVVSVNHPLAKLQAEKDWLHMEDVYQHTIFRVTMSPGMTAFIDTVVEYGRRGSGGAVVAVPMLLAARFVMLGQGMTFLPRSYVQRYVNEGRVVFLKIQDMPQVLNEPLLVSLRGRELDFVHREFLRIFKTRWKHMLVQEAHL